MGWMWYAVLILIIFFALNGFRRGLIRTVFSMVSLLLIMLLVSIINPYIGEILWDKTPIEERIKEQITELIEEKDNMEADTGVAKEMKIIESLPIPDKIKDSLVENNNSEVYEVLAVNDFSDYISIFLTRIIINGIAYILSFIVASICVRIIVNVLDLVTKLPVLNGLNRMGGLLTGIVQGLLVIWILFLVISLISGTQIGSELIKEINKDPMLYFLYNENFLIKIIMNIF